MGTEKIAIGTWAYIRGGHASKPVPLATVIQHVQAAGFDGVELAGFAPHLHPRDVPTPAARREIKRLLDDAGLKAVGLAADFSHVPPALASPTEYLQAVQANLDICHDLGIPVLRVDTVSPSGAIPGGMDPETCFWRIAQTWQRAARTCMHEGIRMAWEFEAAFLFNKPSDVVRMVHAVDHPGFSALFDVYHAFMCGVLAARQTGEPETLAGGVAQFAHMLTGKIGLVHVSDCRRTRASDGGVTAVRSLASTGELDLGAAVQAILAAGYSAEWWSVDLGGFWPDALADTSAARDFMAWVLGGLA